MIQKRLCRVGGSISVIWVYFYKSSKSDYSQLDILQFLSSFHLSGVYFSFVCIPTILDFFLRGSGSHLLVVFVGGFFFLSRHSCWVKIKMRAAIFPFLPAALCGCLQVENVRTTGVWTVRLAGAIKHQQCGSLCKQLHAVKKGFVVLREGRIGEYLLDGYKKTEYLDSVL